MIKTQRTLIIDVNIFILFFTWSQTCHLFYYRSNKCRLFSIKIILFCFLPAGFEKSILSTKETKNFKERGCDGRSRVLDACELYGLSNAVSGMLCNCNGGTGTGGLFHIQICYDFVDFFCSCRLSRKCHKERIRDPLASVLLLLLPSNSSSPQQDAP